MNKARTEAQLVEGRKTGYGFGWKISDAAGPTFEHGGRISGFCSHVLRAPKVDLYISILCNSDSPNAKLDRLVYTIAKLALAEPE